MAANEKEILDKMGNPNLSWLDRGMAIKAAVELAKTSPDSEEEKEQRLAQLEDKFTEMLLSETNLDVCGDLAYALVQIRGADDAVTQNSFGFMLDFENEGTRYGSVIGLGLMDASAYIGKLMNILDSDKNPRMQAEAARAIGNSKTPPNKEFLLHELERILEKPDTVGATKRLLEDAIGKIKKGPKTTESNFADKSIRRVFETGAQPVLKGLGSPIRRR